MEPIKLLLVDDHDVVRTGLKTFLESQGRFQVVGEASNGMEAIERTIETNPAIVIMDISMPGMDGLEATRQLKKMCPVSQVLALTVLFYGDAGSGGIRLSHQAGRGRRTGCGPGCHLAGKRLFAAGACTLAAGGLPVAVGPARRGGLSRRRGTADRADKSGCA
jgi:hypothetical protein